MKKALSVAAMMLLVPTVPALAQDDFTVTEEDKGILNCGQADWYPPDCTGYPQPWIINPEVIQYDNGGSYYWDCFAPDSAPEVVTCEWTYLPPPEERFGITQ